MIRWGIYFIPALVVELTAWLLTPIVCLFVVKRFHTDVVKRDYNKRRVTLEREFLPNWLSLFATHDNAVDEYYWGRYNEDSVFPFIRNCTPIQYDNSWWMRYFMRCLWLFRNTAYGFHYKWFSRPVDSGTVEEHGEKGKGFWWKVETRKSSWQLEAHTPIPFTKRYNSMNIGWKTHRGFDRAMYANRVVGIRRYSN